MKRANEIAEELKLLNEVLVIEPTGSNYEAKYSLRLTNQHAIQELVPRLEDRIIPVFYQRKVELEKELEKL